MAIKLLPHTTYEWTDLTDISGEDSGTLVVTCDAGYKFDGDITLHSNSSGTDYPATEQTDTVVRFEQKYVNRDWVINGKTVSSGTGKITNNVPNTTDKSKWQQDTGNGAFWYLQLQANDGYKFKDDVTATYLSTDGGEKTITLQKRGDYTVWAYVYDSTETTDFVINGNTESDRELDVTNNVPNTTATGEKTSTYGASVTLTANEGYKITSAKVAFTDGYGSPSIEDMTISDDGKTASWQNDDCEPDKGVTISGETASEGTPEITVINNMTGVLRETHTYDGETATITVESEHYPRYRFKDPKATYKSTDGEQKTVDMEVEVLSYYSLAKVTITDLDPSEPVTLTGAFIDVLAIGQNLSNCYADPVLPEYMGKGETLTVTIRANENTEFSTYRDKIPRFAYEDEVGVSHRKDLTVSQDKKTATGAITLGDWSKVSVVAEAYPVTVVGKQYGAINVYLVTLDELAEFSEKRFFVAKITPEGVEYENVDLGAYVNRIRRIYTDIEASSTDIIRCGNYNTGVSCHQPSEDKITLNFGTATVPAHNEDNTDFESELQVFLPFAGFVNLNRDYAGQTISLQYVINVVTGNGVALLSCNGIVFQVEEIEPSNEILYLSPSTQVKTVGGDDWNEMLYYGLEPYIYCKWYESASEGRNNDQQTGIVGDFRGFNIFDDVSPIHTPEMLSDEQQMIYTALSDGVYIE